MTTRIRITDLMLSVCLFILCVAGFLTLGPKLESQLFPVYSDFQILNIKETPDGGSEVVFRYTKLRECRPSGMVWFVGEPGGAYRQVDLISDRPPLVTVNRPIGEHTSVPYKVDVAPGVLINRSFATIYNNCHPFWVTQSAIYP